LYYSDRLVELPLGTIAIAIGTVILPSLSREHVNKKSDQFSLTMDWALRCILLIAIPAAIALMILSSPILSTLFEYGKTTANDIAMSSLSLKAYALGLLAFMLIKVLAPGYFARQDTKTPVKIGIIAMLVNMILNLLLVIPFHFYWQIGHVGLALATSLAAFLNAGLLYRGLRKDKHYQPAKGWGVYLARIIFANIAMLVALLFMLTLFGSWSDISAVNRVINIGFICTSGLAVYVSVLFLVGFRLKDIKKT
jgi:putative peptidoglycan lipid II flippase